MSIFSLNKSKVNQTHQIIQNNLSDMLPTQVLPFLELANGRLETISRITKEQDKSVKKNWLNSLVALPAYYWVLLSQVVVVLPHLSYMPSWLIVYGLISIIMQLPIIKQKMNKHNKLRFWYRLIQLSAFLFGLIGLWLTFGGFSVDAGIGFLILCLSSKLWELYNRRDAFVVLNLSLFVCASLFLLNQGFVTTLAVFIALVSIMMAFIVMNDEDVNKVQSDGSGRVRSVVMLLGLSAPLLVVLFLFFPRLPPLWSMQLSSGKAETGMSDSMSPGDFSDLSQSTELAFRVEFDNQTPSRQEMYWRGLVLSDFNGVTWTVNKKDSFPWLAGQSQPRWVTHAIESSQKEPQSYQVILEPTNQNWLFALDYPYQISQETSLTPEFTLGSIQPIFQQKRYQAIYKPDMKISNQLSKYQRQINLSLPDDGNEQSRQLAKELAIKSGSPENYINAVMQWINQGNFSYTLSPPRLKDNRIDEFLFGTQAGFCEHYSSSFTFLMRAAGIPARVVVGYQGGQLGRDGSSWEIRQMDAHAWTEVWLEGKGWVRMDPTSWIAPDRINSGMRALTNEQGAEIFGTGAMAQLTYQQYKLLQEIRRISDQMSYYWDKDIVGFDQSSQANSLLKWFNIKNVIQQIYSMIAIFIISLTLIVLGIWWRRRQQWHVADKALMKLSQRLAKENDGFKKLDSEGMIAWLKRIQSSDSIDDNIISQIVPVYRHLRYGKLSEMGGSKKGKPSPEYLLEVKKLNKMIRAIKK